MEQVSIINLFHFKFQIGSLCTPNRFKMRQQSLCNTNFFILYQKFPLICNFLYISSIYLVIITNITRNKFEHINIFSFSSTIKGHQYDIKPHYEKATRLVFLIVLF